MTQDIPADWVLKAAGEKSGWVDFHIEDLRARYRHGVNGAYCALCDMIAKHEQEPVDRKLLCAREAMAEACTLPESEGAYRRGVWDHAGALKQCFRAIELYEQGFGE